MNKIITKAAIEKALQCLVDNGIEADEAKTVLQALGYTLLDEEIFPDNPEPAPKPAKIDYDVAVRFTGALHYSVNAESEEEALEIADALYQNEPGSEICYAITDAEFDVTVIDAEAGNKKLTRHTIWSNRDLDYDDWKDDIEAEYPELSEDERVEKMYEINDSYLDDERMNLNVTLPRPIIAIADIGRWNGRVMGYKMIEPGKISDCLYSDTDYVEWYVDEDGEMRCTASHHDGTNYYRYRMFKESVDDEDIEDLKEKLYDGTATEEDIDAVTQKIGYYVGQVYGWDYPKPGTYDVEIIMNCQDEDSIECQLTGYESIEETKDRFKEVLLKTLSSRKTAPGEFLTEVIITQDGEYVDSDCIISRYDGNEITFLEE